MSKKSDDSAMGCLAFVILILTMIGGWVQFERWGYVGAWGALAGMGVVLVCVVIAVAVFGERG